MRWLPILLLACGSPEPAREAAPAPTGDEAPAEPQPAAAEPAVAATEALLAFVEEPGDPSALPAHFETLADAVASEGSQITARLRAGAEELRRQEMSERDTRESVEIALSLLWLLINEREPPDASLCAIGRVLALHGLDAWRQALVQRIEGEGGTIEDAAIAPDCSALGDVGTEAEECQYAADLAEAYRVAFAQDGPLARLEEAFESGPRATAAAIEAHLEESAPLHRLLDARPRRRDVADLGAMCRLAP